MKQKWAATNTHIFNFKSIVFISLLSIIKLTSPSTVTTTSPAFLLIKEITDSNNDSIDIKDLQKQEKATLNLKPCIMVAYAGPSAI